MAKKFISLIVVPHSAAGCRHISISKKAFKFLSSVALVLFLAFIFFAVDYVSVKSTRVQYRNLQAETLSQKKTIAEYETSLSKLKQIIDNYEHYAQKLNVMAGINVPEPDKEPGVGGKSLENPEDQGIILPPQQFSSPNLKGIGQKAENVETNLSNLMAYFENQAVRLAHTPTIWPTIGWLTSGFQWRNDPFTGKLAFHKGIDVACNIGNPVVATADGIVVQVEYNKESGKTVLISHGGGFTTLYYHLDKYFVKVGQKVKRGDVIGLVGKTGRALGPHLHYEVRINDRAVNPRLYILEE
jgi:murein DD-endopeptidase MepM/ murein hydrolase activator NlpD